MSIHFLPNVLTINFPKAKQNKRIYNHVRNSLLSITKIMQLAFQQSNLYLGQIQFLEKKEHTHEVDPRIADKIGLISQCSHLNGGPAKKISTKQN